jgi:D-alanyl-D-alanine carboxypeptidase/D-alanyl-D-alanine-endopeptidase (penicillin-binding protein 4)
MIITTGGPRVALALLATALTLVPVLSATAGRASAATGAPAGSSARPATDVNAATAPTAADRTVAARLRVRFPAAGLGPGRVGQVLDVASGRTVWASGAEDGRMPASTDKLAVAVAALTVLGPAHTERTRTRYAAGTLYLVGGGDQLLTAYGLRALAVATATALRQHHLPVGAFRVDDSLFPAPSAATASPGWRPGYYPHELAPVRALALTGARVDDTALAAARLFAHQLATAGVRLPTEPAARGERGTAPADALDLASHTSPPLARAVEHMLKVSDNNTAEGLLRLIAVARHLPPTWRGGTAAVRAVLAGYGVPLGGVRLFDGSGLSRRDRMTAASLSALAALAVDPRYAALLRPLFDGLPVAGRDGTLAADLHRFSSAPSRCAAGRVHAKTGSLHDAAALVGVTRGEDGRWKAFAFVENGSVPLARARQGFDRLAATVTGCW